MLSFFDIVNLDTVGVDACIDPRADASIRPYSGRGHYLTGVPIRRLRLQWQWAMAMPSASAVSSGLGMLSRCSIMRVIS